MERTLFSDLVKDVAGHLFDYAALETHPLAGMVEPSKRFAGSRGEVLRQIVTQAIEQFRPPDKPFSVGAPEWRAYLILHKRYLDGIGMHDLARELALSERQVRRDHSRALQALAEFLWDQVFREPAARIQPPDSPAVSPPQSAAAASRLQGFEPHNEGLDLGSVLQSVIQTMEPRMKGEDMFLDLSLPEEGLPIHADRVILRQILLSLWNYALHISLGSRMGVTAGTEGDRVWVEYQVEADEPGRGWEAETGRELLASAQSWSETLGGQVQRISPSSGEAGWVRLLFGMQRSRRAVILVVDDQQAAVRMYQRYLSRSNLQVVGVTDPVEVIPLARQLQPALITLDVMMPYLDGWEILQSLHTDPRTGHIPVIVCSAWEEPELARSLGAAAFLKKPITQKEFLSVLENLNLSPIFGEAG